LSISGQAGGFPTTLSRYVFVCSTATAATATRINITFTQGWWYAIIYTSIEDLNGPNILQAVLRIRDVIQDPGSGINLFRIPDPGVKKAPNPGSRIRNTACKAIFLIISFEDPGCLSQVPDPKIFHPIQCCGSRSGVLFHLCIQQSLLLLFMDPGSDIRDG